MELMHFWKYKQWNITRNPTVSNCPQPQMWGLSGSGLSSGGSRHMCCEFWASRASSLALTALLRRWCKCVLYFWLPIAVGAVKMHRLVGESKWAHPRLGDASAALPGAADGKAHAAVFQPSAVALVVLLEAPGGVKLADQRQLGALTSTRLLRLLEGEGARYVGDRACERRDSWKRQSSGSLSARC